jgi:hypothetical protein
VKYPVPAALRKFLKPYDRKVRDLAIELRALVLEEMAPCYENIYDAYSAVAIGYGTSERLGDGIFHIAVYEKGVNLGFNHGATLPDPKGPRICCDRNCARTSSVHAKQLSTTRAS